MANIDSYCNSTDLFYALNQFAEATTGGTNFTRVLFCCTRAKAAIDAVCSFSTSTPPNVIAEVCIEVAVYAHNKLQQQTLAGGADNFTNPDHSVSFPSAELHLTHDQRMRVLHANPFYKGMGVGSGYWE